MRELASSESTHGALRVSDYIHGFSPDEQRRLLRQAEVLAPRVFDGLDLPDNGALLEIGCGVGAELGLLARHRTRLDLTGLDRSGEHLQAAALHLRPWRELGRVSLVRADAYRLPFPAGMFDRVITIWMLEHVRDAAKVLREALRVLKPGGRLICTEVDNATFRFDPPQPAIHRWWARFNRYQERAGGDPFVGRRLEAIARAEGGKEVRSDSLPVISSRRFPERRGTELDYLERLLLSGAGSLAEDGYADGAAAAELRRAFEHARRTPGVEFEYSAVRMSCTRGPVP